MSGFTRLAVGGAIGVSAVLAPTAALAAPASGACDAYSHTCVQPNHQTKPFQRTQVLPFHQQSQLPFTGAEISAMAVAGLAAIGGGTLLVAAGRRRRGAVLPA